MPAAPAPSFPFAAYGVALFGIFAFSAMDAIMKDMTLQLGAYNATFWRQLAGFALFLPIFVFSKPRWPPWPAMRLHLLRGSIGGVMAFTFFWGIARIPLAEGIAISLTAPLLALYLSAIFLKEPLKPGIILASMVSFAGVLIIAYGRAQAGASEQSMLGFASVLLSSMLYGVNIALMRAQAQEAEAREVAFWQMGIVAVLLFVCGAWRLEVPPASIAPSMLAGGLLTVTALMVLAWAYARAQTQQLVTTEYTALIWASLFGFVWFNEGVTLSLAAGAVLIIAGCYMATRQKEEPA